MKKTNGHIYQLGKKKTWYIRYKRDGVEKRLRLLDTNGNPVSSKKDAEASAARLMLRVREDDKAERARLLLADFRDAKESAHHAEMAEQNDLCTILNGWNLFMECPSRPKCCRGLKGAEEPTRHTNARNYWGYWHRFADWCSSMGLRLLADVNRDEANAYMEQLECSANTFNKQRMFLSLLYSTLIKDEKLNCPNPFERIQPREGDYNSKEPLSREQVASLIEAAEGETKILFALGYFTGLRLGDCCTLKWSEVDTTNGVINRLPRKTGHRVKDRTQAIVKVGIAPYLAKMLNGVKRINEYVLPETATLYLGNKEDAITRRVCAVFRKAGIEMREKGTGGSYKYENGKTKYVKGEHRAIVRHGFHSLRYSYISHNAEAGTPMGIIQRNAGHSSRMMTEHYLKISDTAAREYAATLQLPMKTEDNAGDNKQTTSQTTSATLRTRLQDLCLMVPDDRLEHAIALLESVCLLAPPPAHARTQA